MRETQRVLAPREAIETWVAQISGAHALYHPRDSTALLSISTATAHWINSILMIKRAADFLVTKMPSTPARGPWVMRTCMPSTR